MSAVVAITGSTRGVGFSLAKALLARGDRVLIHGRTQASVDAAIATLRDLYPQGPSTQGEGGLRHASTSETAQTWIGETSTSVHAEDARLAGVAIDLRDPDAPTRLLTAALSAFGTVDAIVCNAGIGGPADQPAWLIDPDDWREVIDVNLDAVVRCARTFLGWMTTTAPAPALDTGSSPALPARRRFIVCSSGAARHPLPGKSAYAVSKAGLEGFVHAVTRDLENTSALIAAVTLPTLRTDMTQGRLSDEIWTHLPTADTVNDALSFAVHGPVDLVAGRIVDAGRFTRDQDAEALLNTPTAIRRPIVPVPPIRHGVAISRHARGVLALDRLESPYGVAPAVRTALARLADDPRIHMYPDEGYPSLRTAIAAEHGLTSSCVALGAGSTALLERILRLFLRPGDLTLASDPTWPVFDMMCASIGAQIDHVFPFQIDPKQPTTQGASRPSRSNTSPSETRRAHHVLELPDQARYRSPRLVYLVNPSMPAGCSIDEASFERLLDQLSPNTIVIVDEAYADFASAPHALRASRWISRVRQPLLVLRTFSKLHGLAGFRVGYALGSAQTIEWLTRLELPYEIATASAIAAEVALSDHAHIRRVLEANIAERTRMSQALSDLGVDHLDTDASFVLFEPPSGEIAFHTALEPHHLFLPRGLVLDRRYMLLPISTPERNDMILEVITSLS